MTVGSISAGGIYYKILGNNTLLTTANNTFNGAKLVRLINTGIGYESITLVNAVSSANQGTIVLLPGGELVLQKKSADWLFSTTAPNTTSSNTSVTVVGFSN